MEKTHPSKYNKSKLPANIFHTLRKFKVYWKQDILVPNPQMLKRYNSLHLIEQHALAE
jgi:hypothetical protein